MNEIRPAPLLDLSAAPAHRPHDGDDAHAARPAATTAARHRHERREWLRRSALAAFAGCATGSAFAQQAPARELFDRYAEGAPVRRYPDPDIVVLDKRFRAKLGNAQIVRLHRGMQWCEGPAWNGAGRYLVFSDIPNDEVLRWSEEDGHVGRRFRSPSGHANGNTFDRQGRQISCCHGTRSVIRYEADGKVTVLASQFDGKPLNAPNDAAVHPDGWVLFTDPGYGAMMDYEGARVPESADSPRPSIKEAVYRIDAPGRFVKVADEPFKPNGVCFSPDYRKVYVADTGPSHYPDAKACIWVYDVDGQNLRNPRVFASMELNGKTGMGDGIRCDEDGNLWVGAGWVGDGYDGVHVFHADGTRIGQILMPEIVANVCFGGTKRNRLFMAGSTSLYALYVETRGGTPT